MTSSRKSAVTTAVIAAGLLLACQGAAVHAQSYSEVAKLTASDAASVKYFGISVSISGDRALVGNSSGSAYMFERDGSGT